MDKFTRLTTVAAPLPQENIDTDQIIPARFLKTIQRTGLGKHLFADQRYDESGNERPDFVLNKPAYRHAGILITLDNLGCGSSREHAPWALLDFGIRCVIAPSFADIFHSNCFKNGILPIALPRNVCEALMDDARQGENARLTVDLQAKQVIRPDGEVIPFEVDPFRREKLLEGLDDIAQTLLEKQAIEQFEARAARAWIPSTRGN
ncbi:3-isopropylmalate dehydratase small subunit [Saccharibacter sp. 17.LH.SD]|uniref:3-isopropylmalate dehydratase small subunit n=1 Tax=Saccharibacter sp. 17.LH.SD TaxID=2689393 RepID=UPI00136DA9B4|nr:3-isopropylmalate dehydratase small subunit [Saccharibacter sp. 17.LH.SD]MXV44726.1 3-isopropylmalate dehydratase small subunit [Saccharibacter sp. 17.LH.SD]